MTYHALQPLVDFHEFNYEWPKFSALAHELMAADYLGDDSFIEYVAVELKIPVGRLDSSNPMQKLKMTIRDRYKLYEIMDLQTSDHTKCFMCKFMFLESELTDVVPCCGRTFHRNCLIWVTICPHCNAPWGGLPCIMCNKGTYNTKSQFIYRTYERRCSNRMSCCGADVHWSCRKCISKLCPGCGEGLDGRLRPVEQHFRSFVFYEDTCTICTVCMYTTEA